MVRALRSRHEMIRGLVAPVRGGPAGAGREGIAAGAGGRSFPCRPRCVLAVTADRAACGWRRTLRSGPSPEGSGRSVKSFACQSPDLRITPWKGGLAFQASWRRIRTFDSQIKSLMLYPLSYPWSRQRESNPRPPDYVRRSTTELGPQPISLKRRRTQDRQCRLCGRRRKLQPLRSFQVCDRERALIQPASDCRKRHCGGGIVASCGGGISATAKSLQWLWPSHGRTEARD